MQTRREGRGQAEMYIKAYSYVKCQRLLLQCRVIKVSQ